MNARCNHVVDTTGCQSCEERRTNWPPQVVAQETAERELRELKAENARLRQQVADHAA